MDNTDPRWSSICPGCFREVTNKAYFAGPKGSAHFRGTCTPTPCGTPEDRIPERTVDKPMPYPMPKMPDYDACKACWKYGSYSNSRHYNHTEADRVFPLIRTYADLAKWWGLDKPTPTANKADQWIEVHPEIAATNRESVKEKNRLSQAAKTLARMGLAA